MVNFKTTLQRIYIRTMLEAICDRIIRGDYNLFWPDCHHGSLHCSREGVMICPQLQVRSDHEAWSQLFDYYNLLAVVVVPPSVSGLDVSIWVCSAHISRLACPSWPPVPLVVENVETFQRCTHGLIRCDSCMNFLYFS